MPRMPRAVRGRVHPSGTVWQSNSGGRWCTNRLSSRQTWQREDQVEFYLCRFEDGECGCGATEVEQAAAVGGDMLVVAGAEEEEVAEHVEAATEVLRSLLVG